MEEKKIAVYVFQNKEHSNRFLSACLDAGDCEADGDVFEHDLKDAFIVAVYDDKGYKNATPKDLTNFYKHVNEANASIQSKFGWTPSFNIPDVVKYYRPVIRYVTHEQIESSKEWNE